MRPATTQSLRTSIHSLARVPANTSADDTAQLDAGTQARCASAPDAAPVITVWYGTSQDFGVRGNPQRQINILILGGTICEYW
jgi:hypothetical protein